jgi:hypothetical protein
MPSGNTVSVSSFSSFDYVIEVLCQWFNHHFSTLLCRKISKETVHCMRTIKLSIHFRTAITMKIRESTQSRQSLSKAQYRYMYAVKRDLVESKLS